MEFIITPEQSIKARESLGISQAAIAKAIELSRPYLSQFEGEKRILDDETLDILKAHYISLGWTPDEDTEVSRTEPESSIKIRDGFLIPNSLPDEDLESLLDEYHATKKAIKDQEQQEAPRGWLGGIDEERTLRNGVKVMLNYMRLQKIQMKLQGQTDDDTEKLESTGMQKIDQVNSNLDYILLLMSSHGLR